MSEREIEYKLSRTQQRTVLALVRERDRILADVAEVNEAIDGLARDIGQKADLPGEEQGYSLVFGQKQPNAPVFLLAQKKEKASASGPEEPLKPEEPLEEVAE